MNNTKVLKTVGMVVTLGGMGLNLLADTINSKLQDLHVMEVAAKTVEEILKKQE